MLALLIAGSVVSGSAFIRPPRVGAPTPTRCKAVLLTFNDDEEISPLMLGLQILPIIYTTLGTGEPAFAVAYAPLAVIGNAAGANPAATLILSTLLYAAAASLSDGNSHSLLLISSLLNLGVAATLISHEGPAWLLGDEPVVESELEAFDRRLESAVQRSRSRKGTATVRWRRWWGSKSDES